MTVVIVSPYHTCVKGYRSFYDNYQPAVIPSRLKTIVFRHTMPGCPYCSKIQRIEQIYVTIMAQKIYLKYLTMLLILSSYTLFLAVHVIQ